MFYYFFRTYLLPFYRNCVLLLLLRLWCDKTGIMSQNRDHDSLLESASPPGWFLLSGRTRSAAVPATARLMQPLPFLCRNCCTACLDQACPISSGSSCLACQQDSQMRAEQSCLPAALDSQTAASGTLCHYLENTKLHNKLTSLLPDNA